MKTLLRTFSIVALALAAASCKSSRGSEQIADELLDTQVYTKVGMHFDTKRGSYVMASTNYIGVPIYLPPGSPLTLTKKGRRGFTLLGDEDIEYVIEYQPKHSMMSMDEWYDMHFSSTPVQLPESLSDDERDGIAEGVARPGMSRAAVFLALGYPPKSTNPSLKAKSLRYEARRFVWRRVLFDDNDVVSKITR